MSILNKLFLYIVVIAFAFPSIAQEKKKGAASSELWKKERDYIRYEKGKNYKGPNDWYSESPGSMREENENYNNGNSSGYGIQYNPQQIKRNRQKKSTQYGKGGQSGDQAYDPEIERPDPEDIPDIDGPDVDIDTPSISDTFWQILGYLLLFALIILIAYYIIKNRKPSERKVQVQPLENDWNPEVITKTELELLLEKAIENEDYRECVRIYFTFILKEVIKKGWIKWKQDKTNFDYIIEMKRRPESYRFEEAVRIYDLIWYGDYTIEKSVFESIQPTLLNYYQFLQSTPAGSKEDK